LFNIIETLRNYFTCELLHDSLSSEVALYFIVSYFRPYLVVSSSEKVFLPWRRPSRRTRTSLALSNTNYVIMIHQTARQSLERTYIPQALQEYISRSRKHYYSTFVAWQACIIHVS